MQRYLKFGSQGIVYALRAIRQQEAEVVNNTRKEISASIEVPGQGPIPTKELLFKIHLLVRANDVDPRACEPIDEFANIMKAALESRQQFRSNARPESGR